MGAEKWALQDRYNGDCYAMLKEFFEGDTEKFTDPLKFAAWVVCNIFDLHQNSSGNYEPMDDPYVKQLLDHIKSLEEQVEELEERLGLIEWNMD